MKSGVCFLFGHQDAREEILPALRAALTDHITEKGAEEFWVGGYGGFDATAARALVGMKARFPHIRLRQVIPYHPAVRPVEAPEGFDGTFYPPGMEGVPPRLAIVRANRIALELSDFLIVYFRRSCGNTARLLEAAEKRQARGLLHITRI